MLTAVAGGCRSLQDRLPEIPEVSAEREQRRDVAIRNFEKKRTAAQLSAARARLDRGDTKGCRDAVDAILTRDPKNEEGLDLLAQLDSDVAPIAAEKAAAADSAPTATVKRLHAAAAQQDETTHAPPMPGPGGKNEHGGRLPAVLTPPADALAVSDLERARQMLNAALSAAPGDQALAASAAVLALRHDQPDLALELASGAVERAGPSAALMRVIGTAHYRQGDYQSSQVALQQALSLDKAHPLTYLLLSYTQSALGDQQRAAWYSQEARRLDAKPTTR